MRRHILSFAAAMGQTLVGVVVVVWNGWDRWQNRRWEKERNHP